MAIIQAHFKLMMLRRQTRSILWENSFGLLGSLIIGNV
jgi:hypothetical protein